MTMRTMLLTITLLASGVLPALAQPAPRQGPVPGGATPRSAAPARDDQDPPPPPPPAPPVAGNRSRRTTPVQAINIKVEFTITDQRAGSAPIKRTLSVVVADGYTGLIRSMAETTDIVGGIPLNVDTSPELLADNKIRLGFNLQYDSPAAVEPPPQGQRGNVRKTTMRDSLSLILESGKPMIAAQSADPIGDRQVTVEVKATILR
jgi:hypothetical protein